MRIGADPEVFLLNNGKLKSSIGLIGAGKWDPKQLEGYPPGFTLQEDNVSLEFGIPPAATREEFVNNIKTVMKGGLSTLPGLSFSKLSCVVFPEQELAHPMAHVFGCEPDYNAWTGKKNAKPSSPNPFLRTAGGHVHVETSLDAKLVARALDLFLGVPSVLMDKGEKRKELYGSAGAYRPKPYGLEYRTLSNFWIFKDKYIRWVWDSTEQAILWVKENSMASDAVLSNFDTDIQNCINQNDKELAKELVDVFDLEVV